MATSPTAQRGTSESRITRARDAVRGWPSRVALAARRPEIVVLGIVFLVGLVLRLYLFERWRPALVGFPDSAIYIEDALTGVFNNPLRVGGYSEFLRLMHGIRPHLSFVIFVQHLMGLASGLLLYGALRRFGLSGWVALVPAVVVILGGSEIFIEHAPLTEALFIFLVDLSLYALSRVWAGRRPWGWALLAGLALGAAVDVRSVGLLLLPVLALAAALLAPERPWRWRAACGALVLVAALVPIEGYLIPHEEAQGYGGFTGAGYFDLYARVAPFAECSKFHPPAGTAKLCIHIPRSQRPGHDVWEFTGLSPAVQAYGEPDITPAKPEENSQLRAFAEAAILAQPLTYHEYVGRDLVRIVDPSFSSSPYGGVAAGGYGGDAQHLMDYYFDTSNLAGIDPILAAYYPGDGSIHENLGFLLSYERDTRVEGPFMALLLVLALLAPILTRGRERRAALLLGLATVVLLAGPIFTSEYDYRFTIPAFGPLAATAAIGGWALGRRLLSARH